MLSKVPRPQSLPELIPSRVRGSTRIDRELCGPLAPARNIKRWTQNWSTDPLTPFSRRRVPTNSFHFFEKIFSAQLKIIFVSFPQKNFSLKVFITLWTSFAFAYYRLRFCQLHCTVFWFKVNSIARCTRKCFSSAAWLDFHRLTESEFPRIWKSFSKIKLFVCLWIFTSRERKKLLK